MPWLGNDIVDLQDDESRLDTLHPRFIERVFTPVERRRIDASPDPRRTLWTLWAAKESAYKAVIKLRPKTVFSHHRFQVRLDGPNEGFVVHEDLRLTLIVKDCANWVHAIALLSNETHRTKSISTDATVRKPNEDPSIAARELATSSIAGANGWAPTSVSVVGKRPPRILHDGKPTAMDLSLSHHGRWVAFAAYRSQDRLSMTSAPRLGVQACQPRDVGDADEPAPRAPPSILLDT